MAAAAVFLLFLVAVNLLNAPANSARELAVTYLAESEIYHSGALKGNADAESIRSEAVAAFNEKRYMLAEQYFAQIEEKTQEDQFYYAIALLYNQKYEQAAPLLQGIANAEGSYTTEAAWYLAIALIFQGDETRAREALLFLQDTSWNREKTNELLKVLDSK